MRRAIVRRIAIGAISFVLAAAAIVAAGFLAFGYSTSPENAKFVMDDVERFFTMMARLDSFSDTAVLLDTGYVEAGTPGLRIYADMYGRDGELFTRVLRAHPGFYDSISDLRPRLEAELPRIRRAYAEFEQVYPRALFPPTYFVIGARGPGGANGYRGLYISADTYGLPQSDSSVLALYPTSSLPHLVAHELVHFNMALASPITYFGDWTNLARAIKEGAADFIAERVSGGHINSRAHEFGRAHEAALWRRFSRDMRTNATGEWFFGAPADSMQPRDIGYFIGYRIVESWYERGKSRPAAIAELIGIDDYEAFLRESGYDPSLSQAQ